MKKLASILLILSLVFAMFSFASCGEGAKPPVSSKTAYEIVDEAITNTENADRISASAIMDISIGVSGLTLQMPVNMDMSIDQTDPESPHFRADVSMSIMGQSIDMQMYAEDGWLYITMYGQSYKMSLLDAGDEFDYTDTLDDMVQKLPKEIFEGKTMTKNSDGTQSITLELPSEMFADIFDDAIASVGETAGSAESLDGIKIDNTSVTVTVRDGYLTNYDITFSMEMVVEGMNATAAVDIKTEYKAYGDDVVIEPLEGYESFPELDEG